ncbi:hypothetical protein SEA_NEDARYA_68 [Gordonia phage Nedarya]|nr:hypothetical protein SEA_NEDARYA_68 [Gordonia phage Nedarya]
MKKKLVAGLLGIVALVPLAACGTETSDAEVASHNISQDADNFGVERRIVFLNTETGVHELVIEGKCNIHEDTAESQLEVTCKVDGGFQKHFLGKSAQLTYFAQHLAPSQVSTDHYKVVYKPSTLIPDLEIR